MKFGDRIKSERKAQKLSQAWLAEKVGCTQPAIFRLESSSSESSAYAHKIAKALNVNLNWLLTGEGSKTAESNTKASRDRLHEVNGAISVSDLAKVPVLDYVDIPNHINVLSAHYDGTKRKQELFVMPSSRTVSSSCFYIQIQDDSNSPSLTRDDYVLIDPSLDPCPEDFALVIGKYGPMVGRLSLNDDETFTAISVNGLMKCKLDEDLSNLIGVKRGSYRDGSK